MSISTTRNFIEKSGCGIFIGVGLALVMGVSLFQGCQPREDPMAQANKSPEVVKIGQQVLTEEQLQEASERAVNLRVEQMRQMMGDTFEPMGSVADASAGMDGVGSIITSAIAVEMARARNLTVTDEAIRAETTRSLEEQLAQVRPQLEQSGALKAGATQAEFEAAFQKQFGQSIAQVRTRFNGQIDEAMKNPLQKLELSGQAAQALWRKSEEPKHRLDDAQLKTIFDSVVLKSIVFREQPRQDRSAEAEKVLADIKAGTITFEAAMDKYSDAPLQQGKKKKSEQEDILAWQFLLVDTDYAPVKNLKPGEVSGVIKGVDGPILYKMVRKTTNVPADFDTRKEFYRTNHMQFAANALYVAELRKARTSMPKWTNTGYEQLFRLYGIIQDPIVDQDFVGVAEDSLKVIATGGPLARRPASIAALLSIGRVYGRATGEAQKQLEPKFIEATLAFLSNVGENADLRLQLVDLFQKNKQASAGEQLARASSGINSFGQRGQGLRDQVFAKLGALRTAKLITEEQAKQVEANLQRWASDKRKFDEQARQRKAEQEAAQKAAEEAQKKAAEEAKKQGSGATTGGAAGGATGGASSSDLLTPQAPAGGR